MRYLYIILTLVIFAAASPAHAYVDDLDGLLGEHVKAATANGVTYNGVDYDAWAADARHVKVRDEILKTNPATLSSKNEKLTFWINAYNVLTIDLITKEGERKSIKNLGTTFNSPWKKYTWRINGKDYTVDGIEHEIIRPLGEPRIHFAINCAAKSCPDLRAEAYRADRLETQLSEHTTLTLENQTKGFAAAGENTIRVSKVMDWFKKDFNNGDLRGWLTQYFPETINDQTNIKFFKYDWSLNKR